MQNTANYALPTWEKDDQIKMADFNALTAKLDAALKQSADALASEQSAREAADSAKADASALTAEASAREAADSALAKNLGAAGHNLRVASGSYTGTGAKGKTAPNSLAFDFFPMAVFIAPTTISGTSAQNPAVFLRGRDVAPYGSEKAGEGPIHLTWGESGVSWYYGDSGTWAGYQLNVSGQKYCYVALGYDKAAEEA